MLLPLDVLELESELGALRWSNRFWYSASTTDGAIGVMAYSGPGIVFKTLLLVLESKELDLCLSFSPVLVITPTELNNKINYLEATGLLGVKLLF